MSLDWQTVQPVYDRLDTLLMVIPDCQTQQTLRPLCDKLGALPMAIPDSLDWQTVPGQRLHSPPGGLELLSGMCCPLCHQLLQQSPPADLAGAQGRSGWG